MSLEQANDILNDFRGSQRYKVIEPTIWLPVDCAPHQPQEIYDALTTLAQHDGQWDTYQALACQLAQYSDNAHGASLATWAMITDQVERISEAERHSRRKRQADSADIIAKIGQDFDSLKRSKPRMAKPRFAKWKMEGQITHPQQIRNEYIANQYAAVMQTDCKNMSFSDMPARLEEIAWAMATLYVLASEESYEEYLEIYTCVRFLAHVDDDKTTALMRTFKRGRWTELNSMSPAEREIFKLEDARFSNVVRRRLSLSEYWSSTWKLMCHRVATGWGKEFVDH
jgi:hypothetical protein